MIPECTNHNFLDELLSARLLQDRFKVVKGKSALIAGNIGDTLWKILDICCITLAGGTDGCPAEFDFGLSRAIRPDLGEKEYSITGNEMHTGKVHHWMTCYVVLYASIVDVLGD